MKVGDLVKHKADGSFGTVMNLRRNHWQDRAGLVIVYWPMSDSCVLHPVRQLEIVCK